MGDLPLPTGWSLAAKRPSWRSLAGWQKVSNDTGYQGTGFHFLVLQLSGQRWAVLDWDGLE